MSTDEYVPDEDIALLADRIAARVAEDGAA